MVMRAEEHIMIAERPPFFFLIAWSLNNTIYNTLQGGGGRRGGMEGERERQRKRGREFAFMNEH